MGTEMVGASVKSSYWSGVVRVRARSLQQALTAAANVARRTRGCNVCAENLKNGAAKVMWDDGVER